MYINSESVQRWVLQNVFSTFVLICCLLSRVGYVHTHRSTMYKQEMRGKRNKYKLPHLSHGKSSESIMRTQSRLLKVYMLS